LRSLYHTGSDSCFFASILPLSDKSACVSLHSPLSPHFGCGLPRCDLLRLFFRREWWQRWRRLAHRSCLRRICFALALLAHQLPIRHLVIIHPMVHLILPPMVVCHRSIRLYRASHGGHCRHCLQNGRIGFGRNGAENR